MTPHPRLQEPLGLARPAARPAAGVALPILLLLLGAAAASAQTGLEPPRELLFFQDVAWAPDGSRIAFSRYTGGEEYDPTRWAVVVARPDGGEPRVLAQNAMWVSWSPDGQRLAFSSAREGSWDLFTVRPDGAGLARLTAHQAAERAPAFSPGGGEIAFTSDRDGNSEIYVLSLEDHRVRRLTRDPAPDHNPAWSPDGRELVFYRSFEGGGRDQLFRISADGSGERRLTHDGDLNIFPAFLPDGRVGFSKKLQASGEQRLAILDRKSSGERLVGPQGAFYGRWSPDGTRLLFIAGSWPRAAIYLAGPDGGGARKIVN